jgi:hypothetical protein
VTSILTSILTRMRYASCISMNPLFCLFTMGSDFAAHIKYHSFRAASFLINSKKKKMNFFEDKKMSKNKKIHYSSKNGLILT